MNSIEMGKRIRQAREKMLLSQEDLGKPLGLNKSTIQRYESGKVQRIKLPILENLAKILNVNPNWIILKTDDPVNYEDDNLIANIPEEIVHFFNGDRKKAYKAWQARMNNQVTEEILDIVNSLDQDILDKYGNDYEKALAEQRKRDEAAAARDAHTILNTKNADENPLKSNISYVVDSNLIHQIPVFESVSAGFGAYASSEIVDYIPVVIKNPYDVPETLAIIVSGDSMYPKIEDGDIIVVRQQTSVDSGDIAVVMIDEEDWVVKKVVYGDDWIELQSINPEFKTRRFEGAEVQRLYVAGKVMQIIKTL